MNDTGSYGRQRVILYARVSTLGQVKSGYSLAQQLEALREYANRVGYQVVEEVADPGESGVSLERPGMDRVRDLVATGSISVVLAQDLDRLAREPEHHQLLRYEFDEKGCRLEFLNGSSDAGGQFAKYEWVKIAERSRRGKLRKAREGKITAGTRPNYGFRFNEARDGYEVDENTMRVVRRIFHMVGVEQQALNAVKRVLKSENIPTPTGNRHWLTWVIRGFILDDVYKPHAFKEIAKLVTPQVAASLDADKRYGIWWYNRERWIRQRISEVSGEGRVYRRSVKTVPKPSKEWVAVPMPDSGIPQTVVDAARETVLKNTPSFNSSDRFWELSGGILHCGACGRRMRTCVTRKPAKSYFYYACAKHREESSACPNRTNYRADVLEPAVWRLVCEMLRDPEKACAGFETIRQRELDGARGDPEQEENKWLDRLAGIDRMRSNYQEMAALDLITFDELGAKVEELENARRIVLRELEATRNRHEDIDDLKRDRNALLEACANSALEALKSLQPEERHRTYRILQLQVFLGADGSLTVRGIPGATFLKRLV